MDILSRKYLYLDVCRYPCIDIFHIYTYLNKDVYAFTIAYWASVEALAYINRLSFSTSSQNSTFDTDDPT